MNNTPPTAGPTWFPDGLDAERCKDLADILMTISRKFGSREEFVGAIAMLAESITGSDAPIDPQVQRFVSERLILAGAALKLPDA